MTTKDKILIGLVAVLFLIIGGMGWKLMHIDPAGTAENFRQSTWAKEKDSLKRIILVHELRVAYLTADMDSSVKARIGLKKDYLNINKDYEIVFDIIDTAGIDAGERYWADRFAADSAR